MSKLIDFFPKGVTPRAQQTKALNKIEEIWNSGKKIAIGSLPTGIGKSHIAKAVGESTRDIDPTLQRYIEDYSIYATGKDGQCVVAQDFYDAESFGSFILTITKSLQDQYQNLFVDGFSMKGKNSYQCEIDDNCSVDFAPCDLSPKQKQRCFGDNCCPYYRARNSGLIAKSPVLNYSMFLNLPQFLQRREILILDEAAEFEDALVSQYSVNINYKNLRFSGVLVKPLKDESKWLEWLTDLYKYMVTEYESALADAQISASKGGFGSVSSMVIGKIKRLKDLISKIDLVMTYWKSCDFMVESLTADDVTLAPYNIAPLARSIFESADKVLMMSATLSDIEEYTKALGLNPEEYGYFEIASSFDPAKSPIICSKKYSLSYKTMDSVLPKLVEAAIEICEQHGEENGIIHTHSFKITQEFKKQIGNNPRYLFREEGVTNENLMGLHFDSEHPTVLISPSMSRGVSLDDEMGRFQIICKAPFLPLGSKRISRMFKESPKRYTMKCLDTTIQMCGRCTRSADDHSITYIIDGTLVNTVLRASKTLPKHFTSRFV